MAKIRTMTLADVQRDENPNIYVLNKSKGIEKGQILISIQKENGREDLVVIPRTFIPVEITAQISKEHLIKSSEFRKALNSRQIVIINAQDAETLLSTKEAQIEAERIFQSTQIHRNSAIDPTTIETTDVNGVFDDSLKKMSVHGTELSQNQAQILQVFNVLEEDNNESGAISSFLNMDELSRSDYKFIIKNCDRKFKKVRDWAKNKKEQLAK